MDLALMHVWAAGYSLPPDTQKPPDPPKRRGKKAAKAKRERKPK